MASINETLIQVEKNRIVAGGGRVLQASEGFGTNNAIRGDVAVLQEGTVFVTAPEVYKETLRDGTDVYFKLATTQNNEVIRIYPSFFTKRVAEVDNMGVLTGRVFQSSGEVVAAFKGEATAQVDMGFKNHVDGKEIVVTKVEYVLRRGFDGGAPRKTPVYTLDYATEAKK